MASVALQFSVCSDLGSDLIRIYDHGSWSHVDSILNDGSLLGARDDEVGGKPSGVQIRPAGYLNFTRIQKVMIPCSEDDADKFYAFLQSQIGKPYDETAIAAFVLDRDWRSEDSWFCSEIAGSALEQSGIFPHKLATPTNKLTPDGLFLAVSVLTDVNANG